MHSKLIGSILLIIGVSIGAGILGLPMAAAQLGFIGSIILLFSCWFIMTSGAFLLLEVNLWFPLNNNIISMAKTTIGPTGQIVAWLAYLLLLYSLLCAYIAGGSDLFQNLLLNAGLKMPLWIASIVFTAIFGMVVYCGIGSVDVVNRVLITVKMGAFLLTLLLLFSFIAPQKLADHNLHYLTSLSAINVTMSAFGWAILIPSLRIYFNDDIRSLKKAILIGSIIPLICYIAWDAVIMGIIPLHGTHSLFAAFHSSNSTSMLVNMLNDNVNNHSIHILIKVFTSICVLTSFLGVSLCLTDFFADGLNIEKIGKGKVMIHIITFIPALIIAIYLPNAFITALKFAGIYCTILLILLPSWMAWRGRYHLRIKKETMLFGGKFLLMFIIVASLILVSSSMMSFMWS